MNFFLIPEVVTVNVKVALDKPLLDLLTRLMDFQEQRSKLAEAAAGLGQSTAGLKATVAANPDPDKTD